MEKSAGIVLFRVRDGRRQYLLLHYPIPSDYWGLAKGKIEAGESEEETALREVREETGLENIKLIPGFYEKSSYFFTREGKKIYKEVVWFLGKILDEHDGKVSWEHSELCWVSYEDAMKLMKYEKDKVVVRKGEGFLERE